MKNKVLLCVIGLLMSSCATSYFQIYQVTPMNNNTNSGHSLIYEDSNCKILYEFWGEGGDAGFLFYNKSEKDIHIKLSECFFILNGIAYDYFRNREFSSSQSTSQSSMYTYSTANSYTASAAVTASVAVTGINYKGFKQTNALAAGVGASKTTTSVSSKTVATTNTSSLGVSIKEQDIICIPPKSAKVISEYSINKSLYRDCNLYLYPSQNKVTSSKFSKENSPYIFSNRISYTLEGENNPIRIEHNFYISEILNCTFENATVLKNTELCPDEEIWLAEKAGRYFKTELSLPYRFYISYLKSTKRKH